MTATQSLDNSATAAEYVAKAIGLFGSRLREPINIATESEASSTPKTASTALHRSDTHSKPSKTSGAKQQTEAVKSPSNYQYYFYKQTNPTEFSEQQSQTSDDDEVEYLNQQQLSLPYPYQEIIVGTPQHQEKTQYNRETEPHTEHTNHHQQQPHYEKYQQQQQQQQLLKEHQQPELPQQKQYYLESKSLPESQTQKEFQQIQHSHYFNKAHQSLSQQQQTEEPYSELVTSIPSNSLYGKETITSHYNVAEETSNGFNNNPEQNIDRTYRTKYSYKPVGQFYYTMPQKEDQNDKIHVSASSDIPKSEIMKQIEKSVIKYMKELEAEGKIITTSASHNNDAKTYYKILAKPDLQEDKNKERHTTTRPKYTITPNNYQQEAPYPSNNVKSSATKQEELSDALAPNVEFVYKIKARAPLQTATVKTISKPYTISGNKQTFDQFDHAGALKNLEEFDHTHVVGHPSNNDNVQSSPSASNSKGNKIFYSSDLYDEINSRIKQRPQTEYRKIKQGIHGGHSSDYKGYLDGNGNSKINSNSFYGDSLAGEDDKDAGLSNSDDYSLINTPYQYILKKEPGGSKFEEISNSNQYDGLRAHKYKVPDYETYMPKYGGGSGLESGASLPYGSYQQGQGYKAHLIARQVPIKRGKRGGGNAYVAVTRKAAHRSASVLKDMEATLALRPPRHKM